jgi:hypothetical protein
LHDFFEISDCEVVLADHVGGEEGRIDWDTIQIVETVDEESRLEVASADQLFAILGLKAEEERVKKDREATTKRSAQGVIPPIGVDVGDATVLIDDHIADERLIVYDKDNPELKLEAMFPSMDEFRLAVRTYVIKAEFELHVFKTDKDRYDAYCKADKHCTWHVHARTERPGGDTIIVCLPFYYNSFRYIIYVLCVTVFYLVCR